MSFTFLKFFQVVALAAGLGSVGFFTKERVDSNSEAYKRGVLGRQEFFLYTSCVGVVISIVGWVLNFSGLINKKHNAVTMATVQGIWTIQLLVTTSLITVVFSWYNKGIGGRSFCEGGDAARNTCGQLIGGMVFGFIAAILYGVDAIFTFKTSTEQS
ncbi:uncharacterized protein LOC124437614 [Xenia sp. Carnegie-2017]|uniref:uncharacterized protein LOC124437614 n=1 Tax=Xenia sp. Carnegie-2017 TaxID=2897299 RepID=UPI001F04A024|nr:uncharacterized protein LOC124437614 [Xenia sp. Carnegie-2017]